MVEADTAFWCLLRRKRLPEAFTEGRLLEAYRRKAAEFAREMDVLRFHLKPSAVYLNPTARCNLNCAYCYIPQSQRRSGPHMTTEQVLQTLRCLADYFQRHLPRGRLPQVVFHGAEPLLNREAVFAGIRDFQKDFRFGIQTNATLLDDEATAFLTARGVGIGIFLNGHAPRIGDRTRKSWAGRGSFRRAASALGRLRGYPGFNVICTVTRQNVRHLTGIVDFLHGHEMPACMLNVVRCTQPSARALKPSDRLAAKHFVDAVERTRVLYRKTGRKMVVANFANTLFSIIAPTARRLMCDISPCGAGRCFFAVGANGDVFPCSEFIGIPRFSGGNLFRERIEKILRSEPFAVVASRRVEEIEPYHHCAIRHFCGAPCPAEAHEMNDDLNRTGAFCGFYEEQVRYAFRLIADGHERDLLWDDWDKDTKSVLEI